MKKRGFINFINLINLILLHLVSIISIAFYYFIANFLYPIGYFASSLVFFLIFSVVGIFFLYKKPNVTRILYTITVVGTFLTILSYILTTDQDWTIFIFVFELLSLPCLIILSLIYFLKKF